MVVVGVSLCGSIVYTIVLVARRDWREDGDWREDDSPWFWPILFSAVGLALLITSVAQAERRRVEKAARDIKSPTITNFEERKFLKEVLELKDLGVDTWIYKTNADGKLFLVGKGVGFPLSDGALLSSPLVRENRYVTVPQAQPTELFPSNSAKGSWIKLLTEDGPTMYYSLDPLTCSQVKIPGADETQAIPWPKK
jgi:hypothetical protein